MIKSREQHTAHAFTLIFGINSNLYLPIIVGKLKDRDHLGNSGVDERITLSCTLDVVDWIPVAHVKVRWRTLVDTVMSVRVL
jgi:hypothetical protein